MIDYSSPTWINYVSEKVWENLPVSSLKSRNSSEINFRCPICGDSKRNRFKKRGYFYRRTGTFYCFNCQTSLTGYAFLRQITTPEVFDRIIQDYKVLNFDNFVRNGGKMASEVQPKNSGFEILSPNPSYKYLLDMGWNRPTSLSEKAAEYLNGRMIPTDRRDCLKSIVDQNGREFILIQWLFNDNIIYHQLHNFNGHDIKGQGAVKYVFPKDENINFQQKPVFNLDGIDPSFHYIFCTEGVYDSMFLKNGIALGGRVLSDYQMEMIKSCYPRHVLVLAFDNDYPGIQAELKYADKMPDLSFLDVQRLLSPFGCKDINDFVKKSGRTDVFSNAELLKKLTMSSFKFRMTAKLKAGC